MPTYMLTVQTVEQVSGGLRLSPGIRMSETKDRPAIGKMTQGDQLELRMPDGTTRKSRLVTYGVSVLRGPDGAFNLHEDPRNPEIKLTVSIEGCAEGIPPGTQIWLVDQRTG